LKIIFFGSDDFAEVHLDYLMFSSHEVLACVTQPDRARGRGMKMLPSPIKACALKNDIPVLQPDNVKDEDLVEALKAYGADLFVVIAYGRILPEKILSIPRLGSVNVHGSLLPKYRGAAPINWAIINGETESGLSIIQMNTAMDAGDILAQKKITIFPEDTSLTLRAKMMQEGPEFLVETIDKFCRDAKFCVGTVQDASAISLAPKLTKKFGHMSWDKSVEEIHSLVRGLLPWPSAFTFYKGQQLKILDIEIVKAQEGEAVQKDFQPGEVIEINKKGFLVATAPQKSTPGIGNGTCLIKEVQLAGGKRMDAASFVRGHKLEVGFCFASKTA